MSTSQELIDIQFELIGEWKIQNEGLYFEVDESKKNHISFPNVLYAFVENNGNDDFIRYIGKTTQSSKIRLL